jgi:outer membrane protein assembly factor BamE (lipoprotein component of BamABCDE complex)
MKSLLRRRRTIVGTMVYSVLATAIVFAFGIVAFGQDTTTATVVAPQPKPSPAVIEPAVKELRGISLGMTVDEVRSKLGKPLSQDDSGLYYSFSNTESAQIGLNSDGKVRTIATIYSGGDQNAPKFEDVFGPNVQVAASDNGRVYKMVRYPSAGFWIAYSKIGTDKSELTTVTMKKIGDN